MGKVFTNIFAFVGFAGTALLAGSLLASFLLPDPHIAIMSGRCEGWDGTPIVVKGRVVCLSPNSLIELRDK